MKKLANMSFEALNGEREITIANLDRNREYLTSEDIVNLKKYLNDLSVEMEKRWQETKRLAKERINKPL